MCAGIRYRGCWYYNSRSRIGSLEGRTHDLSDDPFTRVNPVSKCGIAAQRNNYNYFGVAIGYCLSGSNQLSQYQYFSSSRCRDGKGAYSNGWFIMDVYEITDGRSFSDSVIQTNSTSTSDANSTSVTTEMGSSGHKLTHSLALLVAAITTVMLATSSM